VQINGDQENRDMAISSSRRRSEGAAAGKDSRSPSHAPHAAIPDDEALDLSALQAALHPALEELPRLPRQARSREKRAELLKSAETLFVERGYAATTADDIAIAAGVSVGTFYNYFRNKRQILLALALLRLSDIFTHLRVAHMDLAHGDRHAAIRDAIASVVAGGRRPGLRIVWQQLMSLEPELAPYQATVRRYALNLIEERLRAACERGGVWPDLDIEGTALAIFSLLDSLSARRDDDLPEDRVIDSVTALIERALFHSPAASCGPNAAADGADGGAQ
jgi:AcrR family transcriptional regulator